MAAYNDEPLDATTLKYLKAYKANKAKQQREEEQYYKQQEQECANVLSKYDLHSTDDDLYLSKQIDNNELPTNDLVNKDIDNTEIAKLIGSYQSVLEKISNLPMDRVGCMNFIHNKKVFNNLQDKQVKLAESITPSMKQCKKLDELTESICNILDDDELEAKYMQFKDVNKPAKAQKPIITCNVVVPEPIIIEEPPKQKAPAPAPAKAPEPAKYDEYTACITYVKKKPEEWDNAQLLDEYYTQKQIKETESAKVRSLTKQLEDMKKQMQDYEKYKMFYIKNNGTDTAQTTNDKLKVFLSTNYEITTNHKDRIKTSLMHKAYSQIAQMDIKIFISKCKEYGLEVMNASGYNVFTNIKAKQ